MPLPSFPSDNLWPCETECSRRNVQRSIYMNPFLKLASWRWAPVLREGSETVKLVLHFERRAGTEENARVRTL
jgi:ribosome-associated toxin RatA of RatAB toxin-antitoxin module